MGDLVQDQLWVGFPDADAISGPVMHVGMPWTTNLNQMLLVEIQLTSSWRGRRPKSIDS